MARRPENTAGTLIFQEGKQIEGEYYIIAVYDDPATCTISFSAYELENDATYTYPCTYSEFDHLFRFDSELMNPSNQDGRFHWVIERLDFVQDSTGQKVLCLCTEPTPEEDEEEEVQQPKQQGVQPAAAGAGRVDAKTRAKLLQELDTHDDEKLHRILVKSEGARKRFLTELFAKRQLEQLKASQRLQKTDEEREARLAKLDIIKKQQKDKAAAHRANDEAQKSTMQQLEVLMKQKEAQAIRRLIQQKDEEDRGNGREKDAARQRKKMQERSAQEVQAIENQRAQQLARKREDAVARRDGLLRDKDQQEYLTVFQRIEEGRAIQVRRRQEKDAIIEEVWRLKREAREHRERMQDEFERLEEIRDKILSEKDLARARAEAAMIKQMKQVVAAEQEALEHRRRVEHKETLLNWKVDATKRAVALRENQKRNELRLKKLRQKEDARLKKFRESQFLDTRQSHGFGAASPSKNAEGEQSPVSAAASPSKNELSAEQQERAKRAAEREQKAKAEEAKKQKVEKLGAQNPNAIEALRIADWKAQNEQKKKAKEHACLQRELEEEQQMKEMAAKAIKREQKFFEAEAKRREASLDRAQKRNEAVIKKVQGMSVGTALPMPLVF